MKFGSKKNVEKKANKISRKGMPVCDIDLHTCEMMLDSGVVMDSRLDHGVMKVGDLTICNSPICSNKILK